MNMLLHGIDTQDCEPIVVSDTLTADPGDRFGVTLTNRKRVRITYKFVRKAAAK